MARPREPVDLIAAKGRKHLTIAEYVERKNAEIAAPADKVKPPDFLSKKEDLTGLFFPSDLPLYLFLTFL